MRRVLAVAALGAAAASLAACGDEPGYFSPSHVESSAPYVRGTDEEATAGAEVVRHVGAELYGPLADAAGDGNLAYSPLSIATVLGMTRAGAEGDSATQLDGLFGAEAPHRAIGAASDRVDDGAGPVTVDGQEAMGEVVVRPANAAWGQSGVDWEQPFLDQLRTGYDASMWNADYTGDPERARADINDWVASRTEDRIDELLPAGSVTTDTRLVLANALFFSAPWTERLDELSDWTFTTASGDEHDLDLLGATGELPYASGDGWQSVTVPYAGDDLAMTFLLPEDLDAFEATLDEDVLAEATTGGEPEPLTLRLPPFDLQATAELRPALEELGVSAPFTTSDDLLPMTADPDAQPLAVDDVFHQATVAVDEVGTVAAAATGATFTTVGGAIVEREVNLTSPFLFVIHDRELGIPLFIGRVADPTAS